MENLVHYLIGKVRGLVSRPSLFPILADGLRTLNSSTGANIQNSLPCCVLRA